MDFTDLGPAMSQSALEARLEKIEKVKSLFPLIELIHRDLAHVSTERLQALAKRYENRMQIVTQDQKLKIRYQFVMHELGTRELVGDIEKDLGEGEQ